MAREETQVSSNPASPRISSLSWGRIEIEDHGSFKDVKLYPGGATGWDWNETGTSHSPGIQVADAEDLLAEGVLVLVLGTGMLGRLQVPPETIDALASRGIEVEVERTEAAANRYNELRKTVPVGALLHSTC